MNLVVSSTKKSKASPGRLDDFHAQPLRVDLSVARANNLWRPEIVDWLVVLSTLSRLDCQLDYYPHTY